MSSPSGSNPLSTPEDGPQSSATVTSVQETLAALKRFTRPRPPMERCELCALPLAEVHQHLLNRHSRQIACSCDACAILFCGQEGGKFLRVPRRVQQLHHFAFTDLEWEEMMLPINMAFFFRNATGHVTAMYPSPAGAVESVLGLESWNERVAGHRELERMEPEVEALLVNRVDGEASYFIVPIDECYKLVGLIRTKWRGLSGGADAWAAIAAYFGELESRAGGKPQVQHA